IQSTDEAEHVISKLTNPNDFVLDPLVGTGTTAIAALKLNRRFIGIDVSAEMLATARNRISQLISSAQRQQGENVN
ncbi:MAG: DNA methyltransferase, partial [Candidatus Nitrosopolaris sp.]